MKIIYCSIIMLLCRNKVFCWIKTCCVTCNILTYTEIPLWHILLMLWTNICIAYLYIFKVLQSDWILQAQWQVLSNLNDLSYSIIKLASWFYSKGPRLLFDQENNNNKHWMMPATCYLSTIFFVGTFQWRSLLIFQERERERGRKNFETSFWNSKDSEKRIRSGLMSTANC